MCDIETKLVAWLDQELSEDEGLAVERHVAGCAECRRLVARYREVSETLDAYCDGMMAKSAPPRRAARWVPVLASALAAAVIIFLVMTRTRGVAPRVEERPPMTAASLPTPKSSVSEPSTRNRIIHKRHSTSRSPHDGGNTAPRLAMESAIQIAIPAEAMFAPGALPNGVSFIADLKIAPDGSVKQVSLRQ